MQCFSSTNNIASASAFYPSHPQKKSAKPSAFYTIENPQVRRSANPHFTRGRLLMKSYVKVIPPIHRPLKPASVFQPRLPSSLPSLDGRDVVPWLITTAQIVVIYSQVGVWSKRRQTKTAKVKTATGQNGD